MMTKLMKQLQQWANEGKIVFPEGEKKGYLKGTLDDPNRKELGVIGTHNLFSLGGICYPFAIKDAIQLVLDGTIQVWRPVEHYKPKIGADVIAIVDGMVLQGSIDDMGLFDDDARYCGVPFTHWQPLPQFIHEEKETNNV